VGVQYRQARPLACEDQSSDRMGRTQIATPALDYTHRAWMNCSAFIVLTTPSGEIFRIRLSSPFAT
jgi:hypothetical protein